MSYNIDLIVPTLSQDDRAAWSELDPIRDRYHADNNEKSPLLIALHDALTKRYPCICSNDPGMEDSPWADGPLINNFASEMAILALVFPKVAESLPFIVESANELGITVMDSQTGVIYRPGQQSSTLVITSNKKTEVKPWWKLW